MKTANYYNLKRRISQIVTFLFILYTLPYVSQPFPSDLDKGFLEIIWEDLNEPNLTNWNFDPAVELDNSWEGITMTSDGAIISEINLTNKGFTGSLSTKIGSLDELTVLDLRNNDITGAIPSCASVQRTNISHHAQIPKVDS